MRTTNDLGWIVPGSDAPFYHCRIKCREGLANQRRSWCYLFMRMMLFLLVFLVGRGETSCNIRPPVGWREDGRCGPGHVLPSGEEASCNVEGDRPCCSDYGYCGNSQSHCECPKCIDYRKRSHDALIPSTTTLAPPLSFFFNYLPPPPTSYKEPSYIEEEPSCYFSLKEPEGYMESPEYPKMYQLGRDCCYDIERPSKEYCGVSLIVEELDLGRDEERGFCRRDWLTLPSCVPERGARICGNKTGQYFQYLFQPEASAIRFQFHAGELDEKRTGFKIKYKLLQICPGPFQTQTPPTSPIPGTEGAPCYTRITDSRGTINTPYFPEPYPGGLDCIYEFIRTRPTMCGILMQTVTFSLEDPIRTIFGGACADFFHLPSCGFLCGTVEFTWTVEFQPGATSLLFHFHSNPNINATNLPGGFLINFQQVKTC